MKSTFTILTLLVAAVTIAPRQSLGQYAWVPVYAAQEGAAPVEQLVPNTPLDEEADDEELSDFSGVRRGIKDDSSCKKGCDCPSCRHAGTFSRAFFGGEYLHWWNKGRNLPALVSGGPNGIVPPSPVLFGNEEVGDQLQAGARLWGGFWLDDCQSSAIVVRAYANEGDNTIYNASTPGTPFLAVPFNNTFPPAGLGPNSVVIGNVAAGVPGSIAASASNEILGGDLYYRTQVDGGCDYRLDFLGGFQYSRIDDDLILATDSAGSAGGAVAQFSSLDIFEASNQFTGGEMGLIGEYDRGPVTVQLMGKVGLGNMKQKVAVNGSGTFANLPTPGGIFAQPPGAFPFNGGIHDRDVFAWSPEVSAKLIWHLRENISLTVGYTFLYWNRVMLAGDAVNTSINAPVIFGAPASANNPAFAFNDTDFWVQTIDIGFALRY